MGFFYYFFKATMTKTTSILFFVLLSFSSLYFCVDVQKQYVGGVFFPPRPIIGAAPDVSWYNTCDLEEWGDISDGNFPVYLSFTYDSDLVLGDEAYSSVAITFDAMSLGNEDGAQLNGFSLVEGSAQFIFGEFSGFKILARLDDGSDIIEANIDSFLWSLKILAPFETPFATGYYFNCEINTQTGTEEGCPYNPCNSNCDVGDLLESCE